MKFQKGDEVKFEELGREFVGRVVVGLHDEELSEEPYYLVEVNGQQVMKDESELR